MRPLQRGQRTILKMVWAAAECEKLDDFYLHLDSLPGLRGSMKQSSSSSNAKSGPKGGAKGGGKRKKK